MTRLAVFLMALVLSGGLLFCTREDGLPDPPVQGLVPCNTDGGPDDPLACAQPGADFGAAPPAADAGLDA